MTATIGVTTIGPITGSCCKNARGGVWGMATTAGDSLRISCRAAASKAHIAGAATGGGASPAKGVTSELTRLVIAELITATGSGGSAARGVAGCRGATAGALNAGTVTSPAAMVAADPASACSTARWAALEVVNSSVSWRSSGGVTVPAESVVVANADSGGAAVVERAGCEVALSEVGIVSVKSVVGEDFRDVAEVGISGAGVSLNPLHTDSEPAWMGDRGAVRVERVRLDVARRDVVARLDVDALLCALSPRLTVTPGAGPVAVSDGAEAVCAGAVRFDGARCDVVPSDSGELVDDESDPDRPDGSAEATP